MEAAAVKFALGKLDVLLNMGLKLYNVNNEVSDMQQQLRIIEGFLQDADSKRNTKPSVKAWVNEVRDVAYRIEDAIDTFLVDIEGNRLWSKLERKLTRLVKKAFKLYRLLNKFKAIRNTLKTIIDLTTGLGITNTSAGSEKNDSVPFRPTKLSHFDDSKIIGFDSEKRQIISDLLDTTIKRRAVLSIVGIGGLGKTTLAQKVYKSAELERRFSCHIWLSISQKFNENNLLREILYSVQPDLEKKEPNISDDELTSELQKSLTRKSYFIVLDDVWSIDLWEKLKISLPDENIASRVLITSRSLDVAKAAGGKIEPYKLRFLNEDESLKLLLKKAFPDRGPEEVQHHLTDLGEVAKNLAKKCGGLPLALIVLGSILSRKDCTKNAWKRVNDTLNWHDETSKRCSQVLLLSYEDLPFHLKPCFLYLASFPEDYKISAKHVMRIWIAEGFVPRVGEGTMEDIAHNYFDELIQRCLVQSIPKSLNGNCQQFVVHDLIRDMVICQAKEDNFLTVFSKAHDACQLVFQKLRRATLQYAPHTFKEFHDVARYSSKPRVQYERPTNFGICSTNIRSLLLFGPYEFDNSRFKLLRVLYIEGADFRDNKIVHKGWLEGLTHLRYLGFRYCILPHQFKLISFSSLKNLETIDFKGTTFEENFLNFEEQRNIIPFSSLWKVPSLRHAIFDDDRAPPRLPSKVDNLKNIQTLKWVYLREVPKVNCNISLRKIGIKIDRLYDDNDVEQMWQSIKDLLKRTEHLVSLSLRGFNNLPFLSEDTNDLPCHKTIESLSIYGAWARFVILDLKMLPTNLTKLTLNRSNLRKDPMFVLEKLQCLRILRLWPYSFIGETLTCTKGGFPSLHNLELIELRDLKHCVIEEGAMPRLTHFKIYNCPLELPDLQNVPTLKVLILNELLHKKFQAEGHNKIQRIPSVRTQKGLALTVNFFLG